MKNTFVHVIPISMLLLLAWMAGSSAAHADDFLPPGFRMPAIQVPSPSPRDHQSFDGLQLIGKNRVQFVLQLDRTPLNWADHTLRITVGYDHHWTPGGYYALLLDGYEAEPNRAIAFIATRKIRFPQRFKPESAEVMRSLNKPEYTLYRVDEFVVVAKGDDRRWYFALSDDGNTWRLVRTELIRHPGQFTTLTYEGPQVSEVVYPNGQKATIQYQGDLPIRLETPFGESVRIKRGAGGHIESIDVFRKQDQPGKPAEALVARYMFKCDGEGRITQFTSPAGLVYDCDYTLQTTVENKVKTSVYQTMVRRQRDGMFRARRDEQREGGEWFMQTSFGASPERSVPRRPPGVSSGGNATNQGVSGSAHASGALPGGAGTLPGVLDHWSRMEAINHRWAITGYSSQGDAQRQTTFQTDKAGNPTLRVDAEGNVRSRRYNEMGRPVTQTAENETTTIEYNAFGQETRRVTPDGLEQTCRYDEHARLIERIDSSGSVHVYEYDARGFPARTTIDGRGYQFACDDMGRLTQVDHPTGQVSTWNYDALGRVAIETTSIGSPGSDDLPSSLARAFVHSGDRLVAIQYRGGSHNGQQDRYIYDDVGRLTLWIRPDGNRVTYRYDRLTGWLEAKSDPAGRSEVWTYHPNGQLKTHRAWRRGESPRETQYDERGQSIPAESSEK